MTKYVGIDVDLTVCPSDRSWLDWLYDKGTWQECNNELRLSCEGKSPYNIGALFPSIENPMDYWKDLDYSQFNPIKGSVEALEHISKYYGVVFISHIEGGDHGKSKAQWLKKHFPFLTAISYTREKFIHNDSVIAMVDDRNSHLIGFDLHKRFRFKTPYTQDIECEVAGEIDSWLEIADKLPKAQFKGVLND